MQLEFRARVDRNKLLDRLASSFKGIIRVECPLVELTEEYPQSPVHDKLDWRVDHVEHHRANDEHTCFIVPISVQIGVEPIKEIL